MLHYISYIVANVSNIVDYLCKCIQLGWCVFHLNNRYLGLLIGKIKKCSSEYMSRFNGFCYGVKTNTFWEEKRNMYLSNITIFSNGPWWSLSSFIYSNIPYSGSVPHFHKKCLTEMLVLIWSLQLFYHKKVITDGYR